MQTNLESQSAKASATTVTPKKVGNNPYLANDGLLDFKKLSILNGKVTKAMEKFSLESKTTRNGTTISGINAKNGRLLSNASPLITTKRLTKAKDGSFTVTLPADTDKKEVAQLVKDLGTQFPPVPSLVLALGLKAKFEDFNSSRHRKGTQFTYLNRRCAAVKERTRETDKMIVLLRVYDKGVLDKALEKQVLLAQKALVTHTKASVKVKERIGKVRGVLKDQKGKALDEAIAELTPLLTQAGLSEKNMVLGTSVMGQKTLYVKLPGTKQVVTIGLSDVSAMNKAKKMNSESSYEGELETPLSVTSGFGKPQLRSVKSAEATVEKYAKRLERAKSQLAKLKKDIKTKKAGTKGKEKLEQSIKDYTENVRVTTTLLRNANQTLNRVKKKTATKAKKPSSQSSFDSNSASITLEFTMADDKADIQEAVDEISQDAGIKGIRVGKVSRAPSGYLQAVLTGKDVKKFEAEYSKGS